MIKCVDLGKSYHTAALTTPVLRGINLTIDRGEFCCITGPSGSGKTTLLHMLSAIETPTTGAVYLFGVDTKTFSSRDLAGLRKSKIGFVFQFYNLVANLTAYENIKLAQVINGKTDDEAIGRLLADIGMLAYQHRYPDELSGGMQQKIAIARALINNPEIIFADEPTGNLDQNSHREVMALLAGINKSGRRTIVLISHNEDALRYGTRHIRLLDGNVIGDERL